MLVRVTVIGAAGMLGTDLCAELSVSGFEVDRADIGECDITDPSSVASYFSSGKCEWVVNCAAYTAVDKAETERDEAFRINALGAGYLAQIVQALAGNLVHISTDFVFDGRAAPYAVDAAPNPLGVYGASKLEGERSVLAATGSVIRTSWLFGVHGPSFPRTIINAWRAGKTLRVVNDQIGRPTFTADLAAVIAAHIRRNPPPGIYHAAGPDIMSWHEFAALAVSEWEGRDCTAEIAAIGSAEWPTPARRPADSRLQPSPGMEMPPIREALAEFVEALRREA